MHGFANPARFLRIARWLMPLCMVTGIAVATGALGWGLFEAPAERLQGETVRIVYLHVPSAWLGMAGWMGIAAASFAELVWRHPLAGIAARACAVPGALFTAVCLMTGSLWGRPAWGTWWVWDGRLTSMLVLLFLYFGWMALSQASEASDVGHNKAPAIFGLVGAVNIPIIHYSVTWWNSLHQPPSITMGNSAMSGDFLVPLLLAMLGFTLIFAGVVLARMRAILADQQAEARLRRKALSEAEF
ncbi:heme ABC transporter permease CcmC [Novosphingobium album (ex Hu et al. 2023)]|uniref:Heme exporter protein C n=1 Tax=Novosphingobium album (ex Hu et al. 2023) TaxID=2930093 RepID=A0ABT0AW67_9SPHN|nr:heme ABC transporter permease CcmC [Novosphingobium album (ex Hu et al. 2023)]MCJ2177005.1 heme ABC transporter permease CcmC [Novosphingobium album (ex Hu et al. 2023)]